MKEGTFGLSDVLMIILGLMFGLGVLVLIGTALLLGAEIDSETLAADLWLTVTTGDARSTFEFKSSNTAYWVLVVAEFAVVAVAIGAVWWLLRTKAWGLRSRERLGSNTETGLATKKDVQPLWAGHKLKKSTRVLLGRYPGWMGTNVGSKLLSSEDRSDPRKLAASATIRANDKGAVMLLAPPRSGKTTTALTSLMLHDGPVIAFSVKDDALRVTLAQRRRAGEVAVFDPTSYLKNAYSPGGEASDNAPDSWDERLLVPWSPMRDAMDYTGANMAASALLKAAQADGEGDNKMWTVRAKGLLTAAMFVARQSGLGIDRVSEWCSRNVGPTGDSFGPVKPLLIDLMASEDSDVSEAAKAANSLFDEVWAYDQKIQSSIYVTAGALLEAYRDPKIARSTQGRSVDLEWLLSGKNTLYIVAPQQQKDQLQPIVGGCLVDLLQACYGYVARTGGPISPPLTVLYDEAGQFPFDGLPEFTSTLASMGVNLITVWQSLAQIKTIYGAAADTIVTNHLSVVAYGGIKDRESLEYLQFLVGEEEVRTLVQNRDLLRMFQGSDQTQGTRLNVAPAHTIRMMPVEKCLIVHGALKACYAEAVPWYKYRSLREGQRWSREDGEAGLPVSLMVSEAEMASSDLDELLGQLGDVGHSVQTVGLGDAVPIERGRGPRRVSLVSGWQ